MVALRLAPGPRVGEVLRRAREAQALGAITTRDQALAWLRQSSAPGADEAVSDGKP